MAEFTFDGTAVRDKSGQKMGEVDRSYVRGWNGALLGQIDRKNVRDHRGRKVLEFDGKTIKDDLGKKVGTIKDVLSEIEGEADIATVAAWYYLIKQRQANMT